MPYKVGLIIVTYNSQKDIIRLLDSIIIQDYKNVIVYVIDNNSQDETLKLIEKYNSEISIIIISCMTNNGFAKGNNIGILKALDDGCDLIFILNPDMQLQKSCIDILAKRIISEEEIGVIGPIVLIGSQPDNITQAFGANANFRTQKKNDLFPNTKLTNEIPEEVYVDYVLGGAMMIKSSVLKITGFFEEDYFMYNDELDLAYRIKKAGFKTMCLRDAIVRHFHDFNTQNKKGYNLMYYYMMRNKYLYFKKFRLYGNLFFSLISEFIKLPFVANWALRRMKNIRLLKFYYFGILDGLLGKKGIAKNQVNHLINS